MKNFTKITMIFASLFVIVNCSPQNSSNGNVGVTATTDGACSYYSNGQCYSASGNPVQGLSLSNGFYADNYSGTSSFQITNVALMKEFYKMGMGVCDRGAKNYQNIGSANCDFYIQGYTDIVVQFPPNGQGQAIVTFIAKPKQNPYVNYSGQLPSGWGLLGAAIGYFTGVYIPDPSYYTGAYRDPLQIPMTVSPTNNSLGFEARGYGDYWTGLNKTLVAIQVLNGNVNSSNLTYNLLIGGQVAANGVMSKCQYANCGL